MRVQTLVGAVLLLAAFVVGVVVRDRARLREGEDLKPRPDALEYGLAARSLVTEGRFAIDVGGVAFAPRYPIGFPALAAPFVALRGGDPAGVVDAAYTYGLLLIVLLAVLGYLSAGALGAVVAATLGALSPALVRASTLGLSETASACAITAALVGFILAHHRLGRGWTRSWLALAGLALAAAFAIRVTAVLLVPALVAATWTMRGQTSRAERLRESTWLLAPLAVIGAAIAAWNASRFGSPFHDGYRFWVPELYGNRELLFSMRYALSPVPGYWDRSHLDVYAHALGGRDAYLWTTGALLLAGLGLARGLTVERRCLVARTLVWTIATFVPVLVLFHLLYAWQDRRFLVPAIPIVAALAGAGAEFVRTGMARSSKRFAWLAFALPVFLGFDLAERQEARAPGSTPPSLHDALHGARTQIADDAVLVVNFPVSLARAWLGAHEVWVQDRASADPQHLERAARQGRRGLDGDVPEARSLIEGGQPDASAVDALIAVAATRPVLLLTAIGEGDGAAARAALLRSADFEPVLAGPTVTIERIVPRRPR
ncbi:MAG: hypothetical protein IPH13_09800 [Planctomycetes bacterium]|nr:hypothetical protein [Planctomycetota bacterium]MCC7171845.1 hypothetical protein [Planctomycetota bacterium]